MKVIYTKFIPFSGFKAINLFGVLFVRKGCVLRERVINHKKIHTRQMKELLYIFFYLWYFIEWVIRLFGEGNAYRNISFEREAYENQSNRYYLEFREPFDFFQYY